MLSVQLRKNISEVDYLSLCRSLSIYVQRWVACCTFHDLHPEERSAYLCFSFEAIFSAVSATRPRADVAYCIHALARRLSKTHNWAVWTFSHQTNIQDFIHSQEAFFVCLFSCIYSWNNLHLDCHSWATIVSGRKLKKEEEEDTLETRLNVHGFLVCKGRTHVT